MYPRKLNLRELLKKKSHFLFGPRAVGKSTLIATELPNALVFDLLDDTTFRDLLRQPSLIGERITPKHQIVVIDEIQRIPELLNEIHRLIFQKKGTFLLTGSSARKLKHGSANLLAGRAWEANLFPLTFSEITDFDLLKLLNRGGLPDAYLSEDYKRELHSYVSLYLQEEVKAEALTRNVQGFSEFLDLVGRSNGQEINYERFAADCQVSTSTLKNYFQILEDTLIGFRLSGYCKSTKRKAVSRAKHYLFDLGVKNALTKSWIEAETSLLFGEAFEHFIALELRAYLKYAEREESLQYWRTTSQFEVDFVVGQKLAIEVKSSTLVNASHLKGLLALQEEKLGHRLIVVSRDEHRRTTAEGIEIFPYGEFLTELWEGRLI